MLSNLEVKVIKFPSEYLSETVSYVNTPVSELTSEMAKKGGPT